MAARKPLDQLSPAYRRRIERAEARGRGRAEARGHKAEAAEKRARNEASRAKFGGSTDVVRKLRRQTVEHMLRQWRDVGKGRVSRETVEKGVRILTVEIMRQVLQMNGAQLLRLANVGVEIAKGADGRQYNPRRHYQAFILEYPELANDDDWVPFWYHP